MMGRSHMICGVVAGLAASAVLPVPPELAPLVVLVAAYSALVPDADHWSAPAAHCLPPISWATCWLIRTVSVRTTGTAHRGFSHSLAFAAGWAVLLGGVSVVWLPVSSATWIAAAAMLGCLAHLAGDIPTLSGCDHVLWPYRVRVPWPPLLRFRVGGPAEARVVAGVIAVGAWCGWLLLGG